MTRIVTHSGKLIDLVDPQQDEICIEDIAHALSLINRFNGSTTRAYSVAAHSVWVSLIVDREVALQALLHDAQEAYLGDVTSPLKKALPDYRRIETNFSDAIAEKFGISAVLDRRVRIADRIAYVSERAVLLTPVALANATVEDGINNGIHGMRPHVLPVIHQLYDTEQLFLARFEELYDDS